MVMPLPKFVFGGATGKTYEDVKKERDAYLRALAQRQFMTDPVAAATYLGGQLHNLIAAGLASAELARMDKEGSGLFQQLMQEALGDVGGAQAPATDATVQSASFPGAAVTAPPQSPRAKLPRGLRNHNPGNIEYGEFARKAGAVGSDGRFARFKTLEDGYRAMYRLLSSYQRRGLRTLRQMINRWAPPRENDTGAYVARVAKIAGVDPDAPIDLSNPKVAARVMHGMTVVENGFAPAPPDYIERAVLTAGVTPKQIAAAIGGDARKISRALGVGQNTRLNMHDAPTRHFVTQAIQSAQPDARQAGEMYQAGGEDLAEYLRLADDFPPPPSPPPITPPEKREQAITRLLRVLQRAQTSPVLSPERKEAIAQSIKARIEGLKSRYALEDEQYKAWATLRKEYESTKLGLRRAVTEALIKRRLNPMTVAPGNVVYDPITRQSIFRAAPKQTELEKMLAETNAQRAAQGLPPLTMFELKKELQRAGATQININNTEDAAAAMRKKMLESTAVRLVKLKDAVAKAQSARTDLQILEELLNVVPQGPATGRVQELMGQFGVSSPADLFVRLTQQLVPKLRSPGMAACLIRTSK